MRFLREWIEFIDYLKSFDGIKLFYYEGKRSEI